MSLTIELLDVLGIENPYKVGNLHYVFEGVGWCYEFRKTGFSTEKSAFSFVYEKTMTPKHIRNMLETFFKTDNPCAEIFDAHGNHIDNTEL